MGVLDIADDDQCLFLPCQLHIDKNGNRLRFCFHNMLTTSTHNPATLFSKYRIITSISFYFIPYV